MHELNAASLPNNTNVGLAITVPPNSQTLAVAHADATFGDSFVPLAGKFTSLIVRGAKLDMNLGGTSYSGPQGTADISAPSASLQLCITTGSAPLFAYAESMSELSRP